MNIGVFFSPVNDRSFPEYCYYRMAGKCLTWLNQGFLAYLTDDLFRVQKRLRLTIGRSHFFVPGKDLSTPQENTVLIGYFERMLIFMGV